MSTLPSDSQKLVPAPGLPGSVLRGTLVGLIPLGLLVVVLALVLAITALTRQLLATSGFFVQQEWVLIVLIAGMVLAIVVYAGSIWRILRRVATWQQAGMREQARSALWALGATALVVLIPVLLTLLLPQRPAP
jgi:hypothetical protein